MAAYSMSGGLGFDSLVPRSLNRRREARDTAVSARILANGPGVSMLFPSVRPLVLTGDDLTVLVLHALVLYIGRTFG